jgi:carbamoyltransferase
MYSAQERQDTKSLPVVQIGGIMSNIMGIGGSTHDFAACLIREDSRVIAIEEERISRIRYALNSSQPCKEPFEYCLQAADLRVEDIDAIMGNDMLEGVIDGDLFPNAQLINHHLTHAASTFFTSPFETAAILVCDGAGSLIPSLATGEKERETASFAYGDGNDISIIGRVTGSSSGIRFRSDTPRLRENSVGDLYRAVTETIGFGFLHDGKTMGLAPYGDDRYVEEVMRFVKLGANGDFQIHLSGENGLIVRLQEIRKRDAVLNNQFETDAALGYAGQFALELVLQHVLDHLWRLCHTPNLCIAGGVGLNSLANGKIPSISKFKNIHVVYAPGDGGTAIGAAAWGFAQSVGRTAESVRLASSPYLGRAYAMSEIVNALHQSGTDFRQPEDLYSEVAEMLDAGLIVAWYQGESEFGPRALGNRSILADPRSVEIRDRVNSVIKHREWFRPLAPIVIENVASTYFELPFPSPWMQFVWPVRPEYRSILAGITHVDGSARVQTVNSAQNHALYSILEAFEQVSGYPILLNTSFNIRAEPIVETPRDAIQTFLSSEIDILVLGEFLVSNHNRVVG